MPARVVVVHDEPEFAREAADALRLAGYDVADFTDSMTALEALLGAASIELLVTRVRFGPGKPHGISLAMMTRRRRPQVRVIFTALPEDEETVRGIGVFMPLPVSVPDLVREVGRLLSSSPPS